MLMKYLIILHVLPLMPTADRVANNEFCAASRREAEQCGAYAFKIVQPLLDYFRSIRSTIENSDNISKTRDSEIRYLELQLAEFRQKVSNHVQAIDLYEQLKHSQTTQIQFLTHQNDIKLAELTQLNRTIAAKSATITEQSNQISKQKSQIDTDRQTIEKIRYQLEHQSELIREKNTQIANLQAQKQELDDKLKVILVRLDNYSERVSLDSCIPFANSPSIHKISVPNVEPFDVLCGRAATGPGWIVIQQRINGKENFYRDWATYEAGFGSFDGDFFLGLEKIHQLTTHQRHKLYIHLEEFNGNITYATYKHFAIAGKADQYALISIGSMSGNSTAGDLMEYHVGHKFYTFDRDNSHNCSSKCRGGWWYHNCAIANLNGKYFDHEIRNPSTIYWYGYRSLKKVQMLMRPNVV